LEIEVKSPFASRDKFDFALWIKAINLAIAGEGFLALA
jgi:hypothetical protein